MKLFAGIAMLALLLPGTTAAQAAAPSLASAVEELVHEWYEQQTGDLPPEELPEQELIIVDIADMRDNVMRRISEVLENSDALAGEIPDDAANTAAMTRLVEAYKGLESTTPVFTQLALSKASDPAYQSGWRLCAIRVIAETWLPQIQETRAQMDTAALPPCEADLRPVQAEMLPLQPPRTEYDPGGSAVVEFAIAPTGAVSNPWFVEWSVTPSDDFMRDYVTRSVQGWRYAARENACRLQRTITFEIAGSQEVSPPTLRDDIRVRFPEFYVEIAKRYDSADVPAVLEILDSEDDEGIWPRAASLLGIVGDDAVADELIELAERPYIGSTYISSLQQATRREAMRGLGFLVSRTGNAQALEYLIESLDDSIWRRRNVVGVSSAFESQDQYDRQLSIYAIFGLTLSGHPQAGQALRSLQQAPTSGQVLLRRELDSTLDTWLEIYDVVAERGVAGMFEYYENERRLRGGQFGE